ncbi:hypothetical protein EBU91_04910 [bacterium]|nr:hypothetical protein [bacterium]
MKKLKCVYMTDSFMMPVLKTAFNRTLDEQNYPGIDMTLTEQSTIEVKWRDVEFGFPMIFARAWVVDTEATTKESGFKFMKEKRA